ncbi:MAG: Ig-like domain-containing protein, partial [Verrucomicrobiales bacterium]|nr:Ig-like domain-containing protein [Verrucomicrobiales bacterium]
MRSGHALGGGRILGVLAGLTTLLAFDGVAQPKLQVDLGAPPDIQLRWPAPDAGYTLESALQLGPGATWQSVSTPPTLAEGRWSVAIRPADSRRFFRLRQSTPALTRIVETSPSQGETGVAVTRESILRLSAPLAPDAVVDPDHFAVNFAGRRLLSRAEVSSDRQTVRLFYLENLPAAAHLSATFDASGIRDMAGNEVDANADGSPGGIYSLEFETASLTGLPNTAVIGTVFASEKNADGSNHPLENVTVTVDGAEETLRATTDASGRFRLQPAPAGRFFVHVDGRTAVGSQWPNGAYYPVVGKAWDAVAGGTNNLAGGSGEVYLPLIQSDALQPVSAVDSTRITFSPSVLATNPALAGVELTVPPNALFGDNGTRGGKVGIAPVPPDRLPEPLPPGLDLPLVITVQTDGAANFDTPVPVKFPNLPDPTTGARLGPGEKTVIWSFNHDTGRWEPQGAATISADGQFVVSDPGVGIRQPGWHGWFPGSPGSGPAPPGPPGPSGPPPCEGPGCKCTQERICVIPHEGRHYALCALSCLGNIWDRFRDPNKTPRPPIEDGLRCIGGPDKCPGTPEDVLTKKQRDCMDACRYPDSEFIRYTVPCEGFEDPCPPSPNLHGLGAIKTALADAVSPLSPGFIPIADPLEEQFYIWAVEEEYLLRLTGTEKFVQTEVEDIPRMNTFLDLFSTYVGAGSEAGIHLGAVERAELLAMPRPSQFTAIEWQVMIDRLDSLQGAELPAAVAVAKTRLDNAIALLVSRGWKRRLDGLFDGFVLQSRARAPELGSEQFPARPHFYYLKNHDTGFVQRGRLSPSGTFEGIILATDSYYTVLYYDPVTRYGGGAFFKSRAAGVETEILTAPLEPFPADQPDLDHDLVPDVVEQILGTNPDGADSDGDGTPDGAELASATNPLDGIPVTIGVRMILDTPGIAVDVTSWNDLVAVADGSEGVALFDASNPTTPVRLAQIAIPGQSAAVAGSGGLLAVATGASGVAIYDVSNANQPVRLSHRSLGTPATSVGIAGERVIAGLVSGEVALLDVFGEVLQRSSLGNQIQDVLVRGDVIYALEMGKLHILTLEDRTLTSRGSIDVPGAQGGGGFGPRLRLTSDHARLFVTHTLGFTVLDLTDPLKPVLLRDVPTQQAGWKQIVPDGSGLAVGAVNANSTGEGPHDVSLFDLGLESTNATLFTTFVTPGIAQAVSLHEGMAYVADGAFGMMVISYAAPDLFGKPPTVSLSAALRPGPTTQMSRESLRLAAFAQDDVRMRSVEFLLDGERVAKFAAPPYLLELRAPTISSTKTSFTLQARATDTGGNVALTPLQTVVLIPETVPPRLTQLNPTNDTTLAPLGFTQITATFSEPLLPLTVASPALRLEVIEGDAVTPVPTALRFSPNNERVEIVFDALPDADAPRRLRLTLSQAVTDTSGNALEGPVTAEFNLSPVDRLISGTDWGNAGNWSKGLPGPETPVVLGTANAPREVQLNPPFGGQAFSLVAHDALTLQSGLTLGDDAIFHQPLAFLGQSA